MSLKYAILGYLSSGPGSGYDLVQQLDGGLGWFWAASHSQIYPELRRLKTAGLITDTATTVGEKLEKRVYSLTDQGAHELREWTCTEPEYRPNRDPERLQLIFSDNNGADAIRRHLKAHLDYFTKRRDRLVRMRDRILSGQNARVQERLATKSESDRAMTLLLRDLAYGGDVRRAELEIAWASEALARVDALAQGGDSVTQEQQGASSGLD
ncbi:transcriptional regulator, PadR-like family [Nocardia nova SH22a]|uniref:Transcriptional regulator, PadR-like family n=1 Tax=Nocardia nova SH22a TaxID=1415166 RepID=W5TKV7_9NOCA|nr:PadR family transcriptional regulator [Nocardia nova]AHH19804.1 transcriptional regulator, PadR-like family [Nocardia nova SH22a]